MLSDRTIKNLIGRGEISVEPVMDSQLQPVSIDLRLGAVLPHGDASPWAGAYKMAPGDVQHEPGAVVH